MIPFWWCEIHCVIECFLCVQLHLDNVDITVEDGDVLYNKAIIREIKSNKPHGRHSKLIS